MRTLGKKETDSGSWYEKEVWIKFSMREKNNGNTEIILKEKATPQKSFTIFQVSFFEKG